MSFWGELKRRNVFKVGAAYVIVAWLIVQVANTFFPILNLPEWAVTLVAALLILGFPVALIHAWAYEVTPEGIKRTKEVPLAESITHLTGKKLNYVLAGIIVLVVAYILFDNLYLDRRFIETELATRVAELVQPTVDKKEDTKTIAVLPFVNLSSDPEQEFFVDGLSEELLNSLAKIPSLSVTSRTSAFSFKGSSKTIQEIAGVLGVANILEGSVRKAGNTLRITAQLIRAADDRHLWSETYDRELKDIFEVQEDIAKTVVSELKITLGIGDTTEKLGGTENEKAYEFYLIAKGYFGAPPVDNRALKSVDTAIELSPDFALAWSLKARIHQALAIMMPDEQFVGEIGKGLHAAQKAIELEPDLPYPYSSLGVLQSNMGDLIDAGKSFRKAIELATDRSIDPQVFIDSPSHHRFVGFIKKSKEDIETQLKNDPLNPTIRSHYLPTLAFLGDRQWPDEEYKHFKLLFENGIINKSQLEMYNEIITYMRFLSGDVLLPEEFVSIGNWVVNTDSTSEIYREYLNSPKEAIKKLRAIYADEKQLNGPFLSTISVLAAYFGDPDLAMDAMGKFKDDPKFYALSFGIMWSPIFNEVRQLPRFKEFTREIGLVDYWKEFGWPDLCRPLDNGDFECD